MDNISVYCDDHYVRPAIISIMGDNKNSSLHNGDFGIFLFEKNWLHETELAMILNCNAEKIIIFARETLLGFFASLLLPEHIYFGRFDDELTSMRKVLFEFINPPLRGLLFQRRQFVAKTKLTPNERKITSLYVQGVSVMHIAESLNKNSKTISSHKRSAMKKMGISSDVELMQMGRIFLMMNKELLRAS